MTDTTTTPTPPQGGVVAGVGNGNKAVQVTPRGPKFDINGATKATLEEVQLGKVEGIVYDPNMSADAEAGTAKGTIRVGSKFFQHNEETRRHILVHESAHYDAEYIGEHFAMMMADAGLFGEMRNGTIANGINGQFKPDECMTESIAVYVIGGSERATLKSKWPMVYDIVESYIKSGEVSADLKAKVKEMSDAVIDKARKESQQRESDKKDAIKKLNDIYNTGDEATKARVQEMITQLIMNDGVTPDITAFIAQHEKPATKTVSATEAIELLKKVAPHRVVLFDKMVEAYIGGHTDTFNNALNKLNDALQENNAKIDEVALFDYLEAKKKAHEAKALANPTDAMLGQWIAELQANDPVAKVKLEDLRAIAIRDAESGSRYLHNGTYKDRIDSVIRAAKEYDNPLKDHEAKLIDYLARLADKAVYKPAMSAADVEGSLHTADGKIAPAPLNATKAQAKKAALKRHAEVIELARKKFPEIADKLKDIPVDFRLNGAAAGTYTYSIYPSGEFANQKFQYNLDFMVVNQAQWDEVLRETIPHEVAHAVDFWLNLYKKDIPRSQRGDSNFQHRDEWADILKGFGGTGAQYHDMMELPKKTDPKRYVYEFPNGGKIKVDIERHQRMMMGSTFTYTWKSGRTDTIGIKNFIQYIPVIS